MSEIRTLDGGAVSRREPAQEASAGQSMSTQVGRARHWSHFLRHLLEMTVVMIIGMVAGGAAFLAPQGLTVDEGLLRFPVLFVVVMAISMTVPMVVWMRYRGHGWRSCSEMAAAMIVPAFPFIGLFWLGVISGPFCGLYCVASYLAMIGLMLFRRNEYAMQRLLPLGNGMRFVYLYFMKDAPQRIRVSAPTHASYWRELSLPSYCGGPFADRSGGLITFEADSNGVAERLATNDPFQLEELTERHWLKEWDARAATPRAIDLFNQERADPASPSWRSLVARSGVCWRLLPGLEAHCSAALATRTAPSSRAGAGSLSERRSRPSHVDDVVPLGSLRSMKILLSAPRCVPGAQSP